MLSNFKCSLTAKSFATQVSVRNARSLFLGAFVGTALGVAALAGCSLSVTDRAKTDEPAHVSTGGTGCLETAIKTVEEYPNGKDSAEKVNAAWACGINALESFASLAKGKDATYYSANSLRTFLEQNFLGTTKISDSFLAEGMLIKQILLGGSTDRLTHEEVLNVAKAFKTLQGETVALLPYVRLLTMKEDAGTEQASPEKVDAALVQLSKSSVVIGGMLSRALVPYDLAHFHYLLAEVQALYDQGSGWQGPQYLIKNFQVIYHLKALLARTDGPVVLPDEWDPLFVRGTELFGIFLRVHYLRYNDRLLSGDGLPQLKATIEHAFATVSETLKTKKDHLITYATIDPLVDDVVNLGIVSWKVRAATWKGLAEVAFEKILNPPGGTTGIRPPHGGITPEGLAQAKEAVEGWLETQSEWNQLLSQAIVREPSLAATKSIPLTMVAELWPQMTSKAPKQHEDLNEIFQRKLPIDYTSIGTVVFESDRGKVFMNQSMFDSINWKQSFIRGAIMGYSSAPETNRYKGLSLNDFHNFYVDFRNLGIDLNLLDPTDDKIWSSLFVELNIFTISSDGGTGLGSSYVSFDEAVDFVSNALSSSTSAHFLYAELLDNCVHYSPDVFGIPRWTAQCYREHFKKSFTTVYRYFPAWTQMVSKFTPSQLDSFQQDFERAARKIGVSEQLVESTDIDRGTMIMHYIESLFDRFDKDHSGTLNVDEAKLAFPLLRDILSQAASSQDDGRLLAVYTYLLKYGEAPSGFGDKAYFWSIWQNFPSLWKFEADRQQLVKIVANLNQSAGH